MRFYRPHGASSIAMERKSTEKNGEEKTEYRYYISSLREDIEIISRAIKRSLEYREYALAVVCNVP